MKILSGYIIVLAILIETVVFAALALQFLSVDNFVNIVVAVLFDRTNKR